MSLAEELRSVWRQALVDNAATVTTGTSAYRVDRSSRRGLRFVTFDHAGFPIEGIEQNPETRSRWAKQAQDGQRIMQFRLRGRYFANVCEDHVNRYPAWTSLDLPP